MVIEYLQILRRGVREVDIDQNLRSNEVRAALPLEAPARPSYAAAEKFWTRLGCCCRTSRTEAALVALVCAEGSGGDVLQGRGYGIQGWQRGMAQEPSYKGCL